jgi:rhamnose utilization protein RhaD (predicted bifunctional aldolase and dehydrogenase)
MLNDSELRSMPMAERETEVARRLVECCVDDREGRPSVETTLHALMGHCVLHTHPSVVNGMLCAQGSREAVQRLFGDRQPPPLYAEYIDPGYPLGTTLMERLDDYQSEHGHRPEIVFLENHGLIVSTDRGQKALDATREICGVVEDECSDIEQKDISPPTDVEDIAGRARLALSKCYSDLYENVKTGFSNSDVVMRFLSVPNCRGLLQVNPLVPDQTVYCKDMPAWVDRESMVDDPEGAIADAFEQAENGELTTRCILAEDIGLFVAAPTPKERDYGLVTMEAILESLRVSTVFGGPRGMSDRALDYVRNWEAERYRQKLAHEEGE